MWPARTVDAALRLIASGKSAAEVSAATGIPRRTISDWSNGRRPTRPGGPCDGRHDFSLFPPGSYAYLLGMYLGDGYISAHPRDVWQLRIFCDAQYPGIILECAQAIEALFPSQRAGLRRSPEATASRSPCIPSTGRAWSLSMGRGVSTRGQSGYTSGSRKSWRSNVQPSCGASCIRMAVASSRGKPTGQGPTNGRDTASRTDPRTSRLCSAKRATRWVSLGAEQARSTSTSTAGRPLPSPTPSSDPRASRSACTAARGFQSLYVPSRHGRGTA
jgi:hypothetical protein